MQFTRLMPEPAPVELESLLESLQLHELAPAERPYVIVNFVSTADGRATIKGRSGPIGDDGDHALFHGLREQVDAVLAGSSTLRIERYGRILRKPERRERRLRRDLSAEPLVGLMTRSGELDWEIPLFAEPEARIVIFSDVALDTSAAAAQIELVRLDPGELTVTTALRRLRSDFGVQSLLCEGGPTLFGEMLYERAVDELFLTLAPKLAGGRMGLTISTGPELADPAELNLSWLLERNNSLFLRYRVR